MYSRALHRDRRQAQSLPDETNDCGLADARVGLGRHCGAKARELGIRLASQRRRLVLIERRTRGLYHLAVDDRQPIDERLACRTAQTAGFRPGSIELD